MATPSTRKKATVAAGQTSAITFAAPGETYTGWEITGNAKPITITSTNGSNIMTPGNAVQTLVTGAGNDTLNGNGKSILQGGAGNDVYSITKSGDTIIEVAGAGTDTVLSGITGTAGYTLAEPTANFNVENLTLTGKAAVGAGNSQANVITGNASNNTLTGGGGADTIDAGAGNDLIVVGTAGLNLTNIVGGAGSDTLQINATTSQLYAVNLDNISGVEYFKVGSNVYNSDRFAGIVENQQTLSTSNANLSTASSAAAVALSTANSASAAALSTANSNGAAALSTANASSTAALSTTDAALSTANSNAAVALSTANSANAAALSTANASNAAALSTANASSTAALSTANASSTAALSTANASNAAALSTTNTQLSTANSTISVLSTSTASNAALELQNAVNNLALIAQTNLGANPQISIVGGIASNAYYAVAGGTSLASYVSAGPSATLNGNNNLDLPSAITGTAPGNWYFIGGPGADTFTGNSSANTFVGGSGADIITSGGGADSIVGGDGNDVFNFANGQLASAVISGGNGTNTINFTAAATVADADFANVSNVTTITGTNGALNISVGSSAQAAGVSTITGGTSADSFSDVLTSGTTPFTFIGGTGADTFTFANATRLGVDYIQAGAAADTIVLSTDGQSLVDSTFARITGTIESLSLASGSNSIVLGTTARNLGLTTVTTGAGADYISVAATFTNAATFNAGAGDDTFAINNTGAATFIGGLGNDTFSTDQTGDNIFNSALVGSSGNNVLAFGAGGASITDVVGLTNSSNIQAITSVGAISAVLAGNAQAAGVVSVTGSTDADTFSYAGSTAITFTGGSGADSFAVTGASTNASTFSGGDAADTFTFATSAQLTAASVDGGAGSDTINFSAGVSATDSAFSRIAAGTVEALTISGSASSLIVGSNALAAGIRTITGGTAADTIIANYGTTAVTLSGGGGADILGGSAAAATNSSNVTFAFTDMSNYTGSSLFASSVGTNVLSFANGVAFSDANFTSSSNVQTLQLNGVTGSVVTVGAAGATVGFTTISAAGATSGSTFNIGNFSNAISFVGSSGNDTFVVASEVGFTSASSIDAGAGTDVISYGAGTTVNDSVFQKITAGTAEVLSATASNTITVGSNALNAGIRTFSAGTDAVAFTVSSGFGTNGISLTGSSNADTFTFVNGSALGNSTIDGGVGADIIAFTNAVTVTSIANVSNVETIYLNGSSSSTLTIGNGGLVGTNTLAIYGTAASNTISAASRTNGAVSLFGGSSYGDTFTGGALNDTLQGWSSAGSSYADSLTGGAGADVFVIATGFTSDSTLAGVVGYAGGTAVAVITDYGFGNDKIGVGGAASFTPSGTGGWTAQAGSTYQFELVQGGIVRAVGNFYSGYTGGVAGISFQ